MQPKESLRGFENCRTSKKSIKCCGEKKKTFLFSKARKNPYRTTNTSVWAQLLFTKKSSPLLWVWDMWRDVKLWMSDVALHLWLGVWHGRDKSRVCWGHLICWWGNSKPLNPWSLQVYLICCRCYSTEILSKRLWNVDRKVTHLADEKGLGLFLQVLEST